MFSGISFNLSAAIIHTHIIIDINKGNWVELVEAFVCLKDFYPIPSMMPLNVWATVN